MPDEWGHESILLLQLSRIPNCATFLFDGRVFHKCSISDFHGDIERLHVRRLRSSNGLARLAAALTATLRPHTSGTAVASLVMGILSFIPGFLILTGIPEPSSCQREEKRQSRRPDFIIVSTPSAGLLMPRRRERTLWKHFSDQGIRERRKPYRRRGPSQGLSRNIRARCAF